MEKEVKGVAANTQYGTPGYLFSIVSEDTCMRDITVVDQNMRTKTTVRVPAALANWDDSSTWLFVNGGPGSFVDRKKDSDPSCEYKQRGCDVYTGDKCKSATDDNGYFKVSGTCTSQTNNGLSCVGSPNYPGEYAASYEDKQLCVVTMLKDADVVISEPFGNGEDCESLIFAMNGGKNYARSWKKEGIPKSMRSGDLVKWYTWWDGDMWNGEDVCGGWQLCFKPPSVSYSWSDNDFSACDVTCGKGTRSREVTCQVKGTEEEVDEYNCSEDKPESELTCDTGVDCPIVESSEKKCDVENLYTSWKDGCKFWTNRGYCTQFYEKWMKRNCAKSCCIGPEGVEAELAEIDRLKEVNSALRIALDTLAN